MADTEIKHEPTTKRVVNVLSAIYWRQDEDPVTGKPIRGPVVATHGEEIELTASEVRRLERIDAILPNGSTPEDALRLHEAQMDAYRAIRGDQEALARHHQRLVASSGAGDVVNVDANVEESGVSDLAAWIKDNKPSADDTVALAEGDKRKAEKVLEAERIATANAPRKPVEQKLQALIDGK